MKVWWLLRAAMFCHQGTGALGLVAGVFSLGKWFFQPLHVQEILKHMDSDGIVSNGSAMRLPRCFSCFFPLFGKNNVSAIFNQD